MKPTRILTLVGWAVSAVTAGYLVPSIMVANGGQTPQAPLNLILTLPIIAALLVAFSVPMIRYRRGLAAAAKDSKLQRPKPINPFFAVRLLVLSKAIAIAGSIFSGWYLGVVWLQLTAPVGETGKCTGDHPNDSDDALDIDAGRGSQCGVVGDGASCLTDSGAS